MERQTVHSCWGMGCRIIAYSKRTSLVLLNNLTILLSSASKLLPFEVFSEKINSHYEQIEKYHRQMKILT